MEVSALQQVSCHAMLRRFRRRYLPLRFGRQAVSGPPRKGIGLEVAHVAHGFIQVHRTHTSCRVVPPNIIVTAFPIERRFPALRANGLPALRKPELRPSISAI